MLHGCYTTFFGTKSAEHVAFAWACVYDVRNTIFRLNAINGTLFRFRRSEIERFI